MAAWWLNEADIGDQHTMIVLGIILLLLGLLLSIPILWTIGLIVLVVGLVMLVLGGIGRPVAGRRHYW